MTTTVLPPGIYRIAVAGSVEPALLTRTDDNRVTISRPSAQPDPKQEVIRDEPDRLSLTSYFSGELSIVNIWATS